MMHKLTMIRNHILRYSLLYSSVACSALAYAWAYVDMEHCWFLIFFFLIPLAHKQLFSSAKKAFWSGFLWACITYILQAYTLWQYVTYHTCMPWIGYCLLGIVISGIALAAGIWFVLMFKIDRMYQGSKRVVGLVICSTLFFMWVHTCSLFFFTGHMYGYPFSFPLLPLLYRYAWLDDCIIHIPDFILISGLCWIQIQAAKSKRWLYYIICLCLFGMFSSYHKKALNKLQHISQYAVSLPHSLPKSIYKRVDVIVQTLVAHSYQHPDQRLFLLPEACIASSDSDVHRYCISLLENYMHPDAICIMGIYQKTESDGCYNSAMVFKQGTCIYAYNKQQLIPFFEYIPKWCHSLSMKALHEVSMLPGHPGSYKHDIQWVIPGHGQIVPKICAELFWGDIPAQTTIIGLVNDNHFMPYFVRLMRLYAHYRCLKVRSELMYSGYQ